jgi:UDP-N-acetylmuramoyl-tripeptide--D-alanyl-D-alanine ligase
MTWTVAQLIEATRGELLQGSEAITVNAISSDTRSLQAGDCFVALPGENHDGHDFIPAAMAKGAAALLLSKGVTGPIFPPDIALVKVPDTLFALGELARFHRERFPIPLVGVTGSNGKTSTKEMIASILGIERTVHKNAGNFNNLIGVPLTLLLLQPHHQVAVIEMGINVFGEMQRLVEISRPGVGLVTNIHPAHLEGLQSPERILEEKGRLLSSLSREDVAVINLDDERLRRFSQSLHSSVITYSHQDKNADVYLNGPVEVVEGVSRFAIRLGQRNIPVRLAVIGAHQVQNALAAAAVAYGMGTSVESIAEGLSRHQPVRQRMEIRRLKAGTVIVDDTYNANPMSMLAAVQAVVAACGGKRVIAVLGEMREMGADGGRLHKEVGWQVGVSGVTQLITLGGLAQEIGKGAVERGMSSEACYHAQHHEEIVQLLKSQDLTDSWVLVKGSRGMTMERVVQGLINSEN